MADIDLYMYARWLAGWLADWNSRQIRDFQTKVRKLSPIAGHSNQKVHVGIPRLTTQTPSTKLAVVYKPSGI